MAAEQTTPGWLQSLTARVKSHAGPGSAYAVDEAAHTFGLDALPSPDDELLVDEGRMSVRLPFADGNSRDGVGDLIEVAGIELSRHRQNPIALYDHGKQVSLPVGLTQDRDTGAYTVDISEPSRKAYAEIFFYQGKGLGSVSKEREYDHALFCHQLFDLMARRLVRGGSIGYTVIAARELPPDHRTGTPKGLHLMAVKMLEVSAVVLPANQDTVGKSFLHDPEKHFKAMSETAREILCLPGVCGKSLSPALVKSLEPWAKGKSHAKAMATEDEQAAGRSFDAEYGTFSTEPPAGIGRPSPGAQEEMRRQAERHGAKIRKPRPGAPDTPDGSHKAMATEDEQNDGLSRSVREHQEIQMGFGNAYPDPDTARRHLESTGRKVRKPVTQEDQDRQYKRMPEEHEYDDEGGVNMPARTARINQSVPPTHNDPGISKEQVQDELLHVGRRVQRPKPTPAPADPTAHKRMPEEYEYDDEGGVDVSAAMRGTEPHHDASPLYTKEDFQQGLITDGHSVRRPKPTPAPAPTDSKALTALKKKYRAVKSVRRKVRSSRAGSATLAVRHKDVRAARAKAESQGLGFAWLRDLPHGAKVRLTGPDERIDEFAREFGVPHQKSLSGGNRHGGGTKSLDTQGGAMNEHDDRSVADGPSEPYGAAVLRRCHEDKRLLLPDYDEMIRLTENEHVRKILTRMAEDHVRHLDEIESAFGKHYKDLPALEGMESDEDDFAEEGDEGEVPDDIEELEEEVGEDLDGDMEEGEDLDHLDAVLGDEDNDAKDMGDLDMAGVGADSDDSRFDTIEEDDATHSMKSLRRRYGKGLKKRCKCGSCSACKKGKGLDQGDYARQAEEGDDEIPAEEEEVLEEHEEYGHTDDGDASDETLSGGSGFADHELAGLREAHEFLQAIGGENSSFSEEDRMKAYHFHKLLEGIAGPLEEMQDPGLPDTDALFSGESGLKSTTVGRQGRKLMVPRKPRRSADINAAVRGAADTAGTVKRKVEGGAVRAAVAAADGINKATAAASKVPGVRKVVRKTDLHAGDILQSPERVITAARRVRGAIDHAAGSLGDE